MADRDSGDDLSRLVADLVTTLEDLEDEVDPPEDRGLRPPSPRELRRFTSEVAIPGLILVLETNIRALRLLQRALQLSESADRTREQAGELGERARTVSETSLDRLDDALAGLQRAVESRPEDDDAADLLEDARSLRAEVQTRLREYADDAADRAREQRSEQESDAESGDDPDGTESAEEESSEPAGESAAEESDDDEDGADPFTVDDETAVQVDVDAELESIKRELDPDGNGDVAPESSEAGGTEDGTADDDGDEEFDVDADEDSGAGPDEFSAAGADDESDDNDGEDVGDDVAASDDEGPDTGS